MKVYVVHRLERRQSNLPTGGRLTLPMFTDIPQVVGVYAKRATAEKEVEKQENTAAHVICEVLEKEVIDD